jgi:E3 ubiquitin-protein ligase TRIP12
LLKERLAAPSPVAPYVFDIRGGGLFWAIEFSETEELVRKHYGGKRFGGLVQARCMEEGLVIIGMSGGANLEGNKGDFVLLSPAYNVSDEEIREMVDRLVLVLEQVVGVTN